MQMVFPAVLSSRGSSLPVAIVLLTLLATMGAAIVEASRFGNLAARGHVATAAALHLADTGLDSYERGTGSPFGSTRLGSSMGEATITANRLLRLTDSTVIVLVESLGTSPPGGTPIGRRTLRVLLQVDQEGNRQVISGSLMEDF